MNPNDYAGDIRNMEAMGLPTKGNPSFTPSTSSASSWQPIETAPTDGTRILIWSFGPGIETGSWSESKRPSGWVAHSYSSPRAPAFWMPLPNPPNADYTT